MKKKSSIIASSSHRLNRPFKKGMSIYFGFCHFVNFSFAVSILNCQDDDSFEPLFLFSTTTHLSFLFSFLFLFSPHLRGRAGWTSVSHPAGPLWSSDRPALTMGHPFPRLLPCRCFSAAPWCWWPSCCPPDGSAHPFASTAILLHPESWRQKIN